MANSVVVDATNGVSFDAVTLNILPRKHCRANVAISKGQFVKMTGSLDTSVYGEQPLVALTDATSALAPVCGIAVTTAAIGNPVTVVGKGAILHYCAPGTLTPGAILYLDIAANSNTGGLNTVATAGDAIGVARAISDQDIEVIRDFTNATAG